MEVTALCIQILMIVFLLVSTLPGQRCTFQKPDFPIISPDKLQFFEYESFFVSCGGDKDMNAWKVVRKLHEMSSTNKSEDCSIPAPSCRIDHTFERHSGEYWCENDEGERSQALNISVTDGSVILEFTAQPVEEGSNVTLHCVNKNKKRIKITDFFKDGQQLLLSAENVLTLQKVSKSDEGFYRCSVSGAGDSPESWLAVGGPGKGSNEKTQPLITILLCTLGFVFFLIIGLIFFKKHKAALNNETVTDLNDTTYAAVNKHRKTNGPDVCTAPIGHYSSEQEPVYSLLSI